MIKVKIIVIRTGAVRARVYVRVYFIEFMCGPSLRRVSRPTHARTPSTCAYIRGPVRGARARPCVFTVCQPNDCSSRGGGTRVCFSFLITRECQIFAHQTIRRGIVVVGAASIFPPADDGVMLRPYLYMYIYYIYVLWFNISIRVLYTITRRLISRDRTNYWTPGRSPRCTRARVSVGVYRTYIVGAFGPRLVFAAHTIYRLGEKYKLRTVGWQLGSRRVANRRSLPPRTFFKTLAFENRTNVYDTLYDITRFSGIFSRRNPIKYITARRKRTRVRTERARTIEKLKTVPEQFFFLTTPLSCDYFIKH